ncbi:MAG: 6-phosphogluconolactonase [Phycisphaeraceae bacterium]
MPQATPQLTGPVHVAADADQLYDDLAHALLAAAERAVAERGSFHLALSGGSTPEQFYMRLVTDVRYRALPWDQTHIWVVDERRVPEDDERSNWRMIRETLADHVPLRSRQKHPMPVMQDKPAQAYEQQMRDVFGQKEEIPRLDFILLGMGDDGHTASLFPHSHALRVNDAIVAVNEGRNVTPPARVTMTYPLLNAGRELAVLVTGSKKAPAVRQVETECNGRCEVLDLPILGVCPIDGELTWYLDADAAGGGRDASAG